MRRKIAAANWKMNLSWTEGDALLNQLVDQQAGLTPTQQVIVAVPFPYLTLAKKIVDSTPGFTIAAQNCHHKEVGAYTGEVSAMMLHSLDIRYCIVGHSERREYQAETNAQLAEKCNIAFPTQ